MRPFGGGREGRNEEREAIKSDEQRRIEDESAMYRGEAKELMEM